MHFAEELNRMYRDRSLLDRYSQNCKNKAVELSWERKSEQIVELYKKALESKEH